MGAPFRVLRGADGYPGEGGRGGSRAESGYRNPHGCGCNFHMGSSPSDASRRRMGSVSRQNLALPGTLRTSHWTVVALLLPRSRGGSRVASRACRQTKRSASDPACGSIPRGTAYFGEDARWSVDCRRNDRCSFGINRTFPHSFGMPAALKTDESKEGKPRAEITSYDVASWAACTGSGDGR
jgi:hypothetical protein